MRKPGNLTLGLMGLVVGASSFMNGCEEPQGNYNDNQRQRNDAGQAGLDLLQFTLGLGSVNSGWTADQRNAAAVGAGMIRDEKRNEAIRNSGTPTNVYDRNENQLLTMGELNRLAFERNSDDETTIQNVWFEYGAQDNMGNNGINIHAKFKVSNKRGEKIGLAAYFFSDAFVELRDNDGLYSTFQKQVSCSGRIIIPENEKEAYGDELMYIPLNQIEVVGRGKHKLKVQVVLWDRTDEQWVALLTKSTFYDFYFNNE